jgi:hypothetical protein
MTPTDDAKAEADVKRAITVLKGTVSFHTEQNLNHLATKEPQLLDTIIEQASSGEMERKFWQYQLQCHALPSEPPKSGHGTTRAEYLACLRAFPVLLHQATRLMRTHLGNPDWAIYKLMRSASSRCFSGNLDPTREMLLASLYAGVITDDTLTNEDGRNNELLRYMAENLSSIEIILDRLSTRELSISMLEATINRKLHASLNSGWL